MHSDQSKRILFYDVETKPLQAYIWRLGDQVVRHDQLISGHDAYDIICIAYCFNDGKPAKVLHWDYEKQDSSPMLKEFDKVMESADIIIGKNNKAFDDKHLNLLRFVRGHTPLDNLLAKSDDLQVQAKKFFGKALPSQSLDYISKLVGLGGKRARVS